MASRTRRTLWFLSSQYLLAVLNLGSGLLLIPLYLTKIDVATYGAWLATGEVLSWLAIIDPGIGAALQQRVGAAIGRRDYTAAGQLAGAGQLINFAVAVLIGVGGVAAAPRLEGWLALPARVVADGVIDAYLLALVGAVLHFLAYAPSGIASGMQQPHALGAVSVFANVTSITVTIGSLFAAGSGVTSLGLGALARGLVQAIGCQLVMRFASRELGVQPRVERAGLRELLGLSAYTTLSQFASLLTTRIDAVLATRVLGPEAAAALALTRKGPSLLMLIAERPSFAAMPVISEMLGAREVERIRSVTVRITEVSLWLVGAGIAAFLALNGSFVRLWVGAPLFAGAMTSILVCTAMGLRVITQAISNYCVALDNIKGTGKARLVEALIYVLLAIVGAHFYGLAGMAAADLVAVMAISTWYFPRTWLRLATIDRSKAADLGWEASRVAIITLLSASLTAFLPADTWSKFMLAAGTAAGSYVGGLWVLSPSFRKGTRLLLPELRRLFVS